MGMQASKRPPDHCPEPGGKENLRPRQEHIECACDSGSDQDMQPLNPGPAKSPDSTREANGHELFKRQILKRYPQISESDVCVFDGKSIRNAPFPGMRRDLRRGGVCSWTSSCHARSGILLAQLHLSSDLGSCSGLFLVIRTAPPPRRQPTQPGLSSIFAAASPAMTAFWAAFTNYSDTIEGKHCCPTSRKRVHSWKRYYRLFDIHSALLPGTLSNVPLYCSICRHTVFDHSWKSRNRQDVFRLLSVAAACSLWCYGGI